MASGAQETDPLKMISIKVAAREATQMVEEKIPPHLVDDRGIKRCSVCKFPFHPDVKPSLTVAFTEHLFRAHTLGQTSEDTQKSSRPASPSKA